jgi:hypothetical protein
MSWYVDHFYTRLGIISNYNAIADLCTLQISKRHSKPQSCIVFTSRFVVTDLNIGDSSCADVIARVLILLTTELIAPARHGPHREHSSVAFVSVTRKRLRRGQQRTPFYRVRVWYGHYLITAAVWSPEASFKYFSEAWTFKTSDIEKIMVL